MAKKRYVDTSFWDDTYVVDLDPIEKLLFLYFMTNPLTRISGVYEISLRRISFDTGIDKDMVIKILDRFAQSGKMYYIKGRLYIKNFQKHQNTDNVKIQKGIERELQSVPNEIHKEIGLIDRSYIGHTGPSNNLDSDSDSDSDSDLDLTALFDNFRNKYPNKKGKGNAQKKFEKALQKTSYENIMTGLDQYIKEHETKKARGEFTPEYAHPSTRLNQERRADEYKVEDQDLSMQELVQQYDDIKNSDQSRKAHKIFTEKYGEEKALKIRREWQEMVTDRALYG